MNQSQITNHELRFFFKTQNAKRIGQNSLIRLFVCLFICLFICFAASAQTTDSTAVYQNENTAPVDTNSIIFDTNSAVFNTDSAFFSTNNTSIDTTASKKKPHSPKKAGWMSTALPGLGQAYNKKYWKMPIVYGGFVGLSYGINVNYIYFARYRDEYRNRLNGKTDLLNPHFAGYQDGNINAMKQDYQRKMETFIIITAVWYLFNILDAVVDAHLIGFNVSDDLSMNIMPSVGFNTNQLAFYSVPTVNITFTFTFNLK